MTADVPGEGRAGLSPLKKAFLAIEELESKLAAREQRDREPIAIVGIGCRFPGGVVDAESFVAVLRNAVDAVSDEPPDGRASYRRFRADVDPPHQTMPPAGFLSGDVAAFDPQLFGIAPREAAGMDPQQRLLLEVAWEALEDAAEAPQDLRGSMTGVFIGICTNDYAQLQLGSGDTDLLNPHFASGIGHSVASGRLSYLLGLQGPSLSIDTACSSSLVATQLACRSLRSGECELAIAGGVNLILSSDLTVAYMRSGMLARDGRCKTFADGADGFARGEGCGLVILKRLSSALRDGNRIYAVIRGAALNQDGPSSALSAPNGPAQEAVIRAALADAGLDPANVDYVEAHGTGTELGDPIEARALGAVYGRAAGRAEPLVIGSVKTNFGHLESAAGIAGLIKAALSLRNGFVPAHLHRRVPSRHIAWEELNLVVPDVAREWPERPVPWRAAVSSFGFSGTNCHVVLEQAPNGPERAAPVPGPEILTLSAASAPALRELATRYVERLRHRPAGEVADACFTSNVGRAHLSHRLAVVAHSGEDFAERLDTWLRDGWAPSLAVGRVPVEPPRIAFAFTGQGSQYAGMARGLLDASAPFRAAFDECRDAFRAACGRDLEAVLADAEEGGLRDTSVAQPALFVVEIALARVLLEAGIRPAAVFGHSLGEYAAACIAGVFSPADGVRLTARRGALMQSRTPAGAMLAIAVDEHTAAEALQQHGREAALAAVNGPASVVVSGTPTAILALERRFRASGARTKRLEDVTRAFHSPLMEPMLAEFEAAVRDVELRAPRVRIISAVTGRPLDAVEAMSPEYWCRHVREPVRFAAAAAQFAREPGIVVEVGPHPVLATFDRDEEVARLGWVTTLRRDADDREALLGALQQLYAAGATIDWKAVHRARPLWRVSLPCYPFQRRRYWFESSEAAQTVRHAASDTGHALLGRQLESPLDARQFEALVSHKRHSFVADHRVGESVIMPGAGFLEAARAAGAKTLGGEVAIEALELLQAMTVPAEGSRILQTIVAPDGEREASVRVYSRDAAPGAEWILHAQGRCTALTDHDAPAAPLDVEALRRRCPEAVDREAFYASLEARGLLFGPALHGVRAAWRGDGEALAEVELPTELGNEASTYGVHPALLDACLQAAALSVPADAAAPDRLYLPVSVGRFRTFGAVPARCFVHATGGFGRGEAGGALSGDIRAYDEHGRGVLELGAVLFQPTTSAALRQLGSRRLEQNLYAVEWRPAEASSADAGGIVERWLGDLPGDLDRRGAEHDLDSYERFFATFEGLCAEYFCHALHVLGWNRIAAPCTAAEAAEVLGVVPAHRRLLERMLTILGESGVLRAVDGRWLPDPLAPSADIDARLAALERSHPRARAEVTMVRRCGPALARALRGECDPLELLFPAGSIEDAEALYRDSPMAVIFNSSVADCVERLAAAGRRLRILEIGAGTGGTASHVLARVGDRVDYTFTDVSPLFTNRARERFGRYPNVVYRELDIEADPVAQGLPAHAFDVVLASNVLHATEDLRSSLRHVQRMLAPGGVLIALEIFAPHHWFDLTVGLTPGWWKFRDCDIRADYPTLTAAGWLRVLTELGFERPRAVPGARQGNGVFARQGIVVAEASAATGAGNEPWLILADRSGVGRALAERLEAAGQECRIVHAEELGSDGAEVEPGPKPIERWVGPDAPRWRGIVHLHALDEARWRSDAVTGRDGVLEAVCGGALDLAVASVRLDPAAAPPVWLVTRGGQSVTGDELYVDPAQATLWGLARTVELEHPSLPLRRVDLDPSNPYDQSAPLLQLLVGDTSEREMALRDNRLLVPRLARPRPAGRHAVIDGAAPYRLTIRERGSIDGLEFHTVERTAPAADEVEIRVEASALNFKDVLNVLGLYPGDPGPLGSECAGVVTRVGGGVTELRPGDRVMAFAGGVYARFVCVPARQAVRVPDGLPPEKAVTIPIAFLTASYALLECARLCSSDTVLIHAATGGVGMAAVRLAQAIGATIYATAGTPEKRALLGSLGVRHIYDSRTLEFAERILEDTGGRGVNVVLNSLADEFVDRSFAVLARGGRFLEIGKRGVWDAERVAALGKGIEYHLIDWGVTARSAPELIRRLFEDVTERLRRGEIEPLPARVFPIERAADAFRYMAQGRHVGKIVLSHPPAAAARHAPIRADGTYLIAGGLSGLGLLTARRLAERGARHLALLGRRKPGEKAQAVIAELRADGVEIEVGTLDIADRDGLAAFLERLRAKLPPLRGVVQSAGVLDDGVLLKQSWARFGTVFAAKVVGGTNLHELTAADPLDFFVLFSSMASITGSAGQANHSAANAYLDAMAAARRRMCRPALSINWGPWGETGAAVEHGVIERAATRGLYPLAPADGLALLELAMDSGAAQVGAANVDWQLYLGDQRSVSPFFELLHIRRGERRDKLGAEAGEQGGWLERVAAMPAAKQKSEIGRLVRAQVSRLLGLAVAEVETDRPLSEMGLDSLLAVEIRNVLGKAFDLTLPATLTFDHPSIDALSHYLHAQKFGAARGERERVDADALARIEDLSDEDVDRLIAEKLTGNE